MISVYDQIKEHLPEKKEDEWTDEFDNAVSYNLSAGFNQCKALYDEVLKKARLDEEKIQEIMWETARIEIGSPASTMLAISLTQSNIITVGDKK